jgi:hypothetical protein
VGVEVAHQAGGRVAAHEVLEFRPIRERDQRRLCAVVLHDLCHGVARGVREVPGPEVTRRVHRRVLGGECLPGLEGAPRFGGRLRAWRFEIQQTPWAAVAQQGRNVARLSG